MEDIPHWYTCYHVSFFLTSREYYGDCISYCHAALFCNRGKYRCRYFNAELYNSQFTETIDEVED